MKYLDWGIYNFIVQEIILSKEKRNYSCCHLIFTKVSRIKFFLGVAVLFKNLNNKATSSLFVHKKPAPPPSQEEVPINLKSLYSVTTTFSPYRSRTDIKARKSLFNDERPNIGITCRHGHSAEYTITLTSCDNSYVITGILLEIRAPELGDGSTGRVCFCGSGLVPVPGSVGICCEEDIVTVASVDDVPVDVHLQGGSGTRVFGREFGRRRGDVFHVGPYAVHAAARYIFICPDLELADMVDRHMAGSDKL